MTVHIGGGDSNRPPDPGRVSEGTEPLGYMLSQGFRRGLPVTLTVGAIALVALFVPDWMLDILGTVLSVIMCGMLLFFITVLIGLMICVFRDEI